MSRDKYCCCDQVGRVWLECFHGTKKQDYRHGENSIVRKAALFEKYKGINLQKNCTPSVAFTACELSKLVQCGEKDAIQIDATNGMATAAVDLDALPDLGAIFTDNPNLVRTICGWTIDLTAANCSGNDGEFDLVFNLSSTRCCDEEKLRAHYKVHVCPCDGDIVKPSFDRVEVILDGYVFRVCLPCLRADTVDDNGTIKVQWTAVGNVEVTCASFVRDFISKDCDC